MKKILLFLTIIASTFVYSQSTMTTHTRMAQQAMTQHQNFMNGQIMRNSSLSTLDIFKNRVKKADEKIENLNIKLHEEERKLAELQNNIENTNSGVLKTEKQVDKTTKKIEKIKSDVIYQDEKKTKYKNQISELELKITEKEAKRKKRKLNHLILNRIMNF